MPTRFCFRLAAILGAALLCGAAIFSWHADRRDRAQLAAELVATKQLLVAADARQHDRDARLAQTLYALAAERRSIVTPAQIVKALPDTLPLPVPITLQPDRASSLGATLGSPATNATNAAAGEASLAPTSGASAAGAANRQPASAQAIIPTQYLKPLYDFTLDCQACKAKLSAAQGDLADERQKTVALTKERDDALRIANGGSAWRRVARAAKWFLIGAAAGAVVAKTR